MVRFRLGTCTMDPAQVPSSVGMPPPPSPVILSRFLKTYLVDPAQLSEDDEDRPAAFIQAQCQPLLEIGFKQPVAPLHALLALSRMNEAGGLRQMIITRQ